MAQSLEVVYSTSRRKSAMMHGFGGAACCVRISVISLRVILRVRNRDRLLRRTGRERGRISGKMQCGE